MRITLSQLRKIIREAVTLEKTPMKLRILDFDDTLAHTGEEVRLYTPQGHRMLSSDEYAVYQPAEGEYYDETSFDQFDRVDVTRAQPVSAVFKVLVNFVNAQEGNRKILILTARKQVVEPDVRAFLKKYQLDDSNIDFEGVGSSDPIEKVKVIERYLNTYDINFVSFFDDSLKNVSAVKRYLDLVGIENDVAHIKKSDGRTRLIRKFDTLQDN